ncbi:MAG: alpha/beta fold hydrolase [Fimbriimonadales bacterium]
MTFAIACLALVQAGTFDQGTFTTYLEGKAAAREGFRILDDGRSSSMISNINGDLITLKRKTQLTTVSGALGTAVINVVGERVVTVVAKDDSVVFEVAWLAVAGGKPQKEVTKVPLQSARVFCSEPYAWHHLTNILRAYDRSRGGNQMFKVAMPSQTRVKDFMVSLKGERARGDKKILDWSFGTQTDPDAISVISDTDGRVLYLKDLRVGAEVIRSGFESMGRPEEPITNPPTDPITPPVVPPSELQPNRDKYDEREVKIWVGSTIYKAGTLLVPKKAGKRPAVLMISGFGPQDRDWNFAPYSTNSWGRRLADELAGAGYAVLRTDDRGAGATGGPQVVPTPDELKSDALMEADFLKALPEVDPFKIYVMGHSEGSTIALMAITTDATLAGAILLAGPSKPMDKAMQEMFAVQQADERLPQASRDAAAAGVPKLNEAIAKAKAGEKGMVNGYSMDWMRANFAIDPSALMVRVKDPILVIQGLDDIMVASRNANELKDAATSSGVDCSVDFLPGATHFFTPFQFSAGADPSRANQLNSGLWEAITRWIAAKSGK